MEYTMLYFVGTIVLQGGGPLFLHRMGGDADEQ